MLATNGAVNHLRPAARRDCPRCAWGNGAVDHGKLRLVFRDVFRSCTNKIRDLVWDTNVQDRAGLGYPDGVDIHSYTVVGLAKNLTQGAANFSEAHHNGHVF